MSISLEIIMIKRAFLKKEVKDVLKLKYDCPVDVFK